MHSQKMLRNDRKLLLLLDSLLQRSFDMIVMNMITSWFFYALEYDVMYQHIN